MTAFVRALNVHDQESSTSEAKESNAKKGLSVDEIFGNLFVINFAGHDTTANTLAFSMLLLAAHPKVQAWISEEIMVVTNNRPVEEWDYKEFFPQLKRCHAVLLETLRIFPPIMALPKWTAQRAQTLMVGDRMLTIPPGVTTVPYSRAVQSHPKYWPDPYTWMPSRWIIHSSPKNDVFGEELLIPKRYTYFPWSDGPQNCPGRKFSEVEAVAVLACLFHSHRLDVKREAGESETARRT
ncbi:cytochrome P450 [Annulohypoxylon bovei var. microspora]|nr:cytochrome P450 [Annulohypoxylon bovei var. microspora]